MASASHEPDASSRDLERVELDLDLRLGIDIWDDLMSLGSNKPLIACLARHVYFTGYLAGLTEPRRGQLLLDHSYPVPRRRLEAR